MDSPSVPRVSVVLATFERPRYLSASVDSVLAQDMPDLELIIADDGSGKATRNLLCSFAGDRRVHLLWLEHRGIPAAVRNAGIQRARGRYVAFQDSDDVWRTDKLRHQLAALQSRPGAGWSYTACTYIDASGQPLAAAGVEPWAAHRGNICDAVACLRVHAGLPTVMVERELLSRAGYFDQRLPYYEDHDLWLRLAALSDVAVVEEPVVQVRRHAQHYSGHDELAAAECRAVFLERASRVGLSKSAAVELQRLRTLHAANLARLRARAGEHAAAHRCLRESLRRGWRYPGWWVNAGRALVTRSAGPKRARP